MGSEAEEETKFAPGEESFLTANPAGRMQGESLVCVYMPGGATQPRLGTGLRPSRGKDDSDTPVVTPSDVPETS